MDLSKRTEVEGGRPKTLQNGVQPGAYRQRKPDDEQGDKVSVPRE